MLTILLGPFGLGGPELILILVALLLLFGGKKIPELARGLGKGIREFKDASNNDEPKKTAEEEAAEKKI